MADEARIDPTTEWLNLVRPVGLVVAPRVLRELGLEPPPQSRADSDAAMLATEAEDGETAADLAWRIFATLLDWAPGFVTGAPGGPDPEALPSAYLPEHDLHLAPDWGIRARPDDPWRLLVNIEEAGVDLDRRGARAGWEATPHQRFERLLRETEVATGLLVTPAEIRLVHAPKGETAGWIRFPIDALGRTEGRPILAGMKLLLDRTRLITDRESHRLPALLRQSREAQAEVSAALSGQILGALHELLRGLDAAAPEMIRGLARERPQHLYEGVLTVLLRLVFALYAEDRDLIPSSTDGEARALYDQGYALRGLYDRLVEDAAANPDTMDERVGAWGGLIALFRLIHHGLPTRYGPDWIKGRGGELFDPNQFPFLEGRAERGDAPRVLDVSDGCVLSILRSLMTLDGERLSYRTLDVEQIGSVYETVMGFTVEIATGPAVAIRGGKRNDTPVFIDLPRLLAAKDRVRFLAEATDRKLTGKRATALAKATNEAEALAALAGVIDERGSPREAPTPAGAPLLQPTDERRQTGSHYTPRSLTAPIVEQALAPAFRRLGEDASPDRVLDLKVLDPAMGSGAFLVEACRQLGRRLVAAWARHPGLRPTIPADEGEDLHARRLVAQRCLYGVDRNPRAVDLARLSLWLATLARDHEFTFLDHALKSGDSLVGLTRKQIGGLTFEPTTAQGSLIARMVAQRLDEARSHRDAIRTAPDDVARSIQESRAREANQALDQVRLIGDAVIGCFFAYDKPKGRKQALAKLEESLLRGTTDYSEARRLQGSLAALDHPVRPFHWEIELPEVFDRAEPGFDAIVGNPPFAGKNTVADGNAPGYGKWLQTLHPGAHGNADLCAHFLRRAYGALRRDGAFGLIATNTIAQGDTRATGLRPILAEGGTILAATRRLKWPGEAAVVVSTVHVAKGQPDQGHPPLLDGEPVDRISAYLVPGDYDDSPAPLAANNGKAFQGAIVLGLGFTFDDTDTKGVATPIAEMRRLIEKDPRNAEIIKPYLGGEEINNDPRHEHHRFVIDFGDMPLKRDTSLKSWFLNEGTEACNKRRRDWLQDGIVPGDYPDPVAEDWPELLAIIEAKVKPERKKIKDPVGNSIWWRFLRPRRELKVAKSTFNYNFAISRHSPSLFVGQISADCTPSDATVVFTFDAPGILGILQSRAHEIWARAFSSSIKDDLRYTPSDCFATFPFPPEWESDATLEAVGQAYLDHRAELMVAADEGMTKTYNRFHNPKERNPDILRLRELHDEMDRAVLRAYGWDDLADTASPVFLTAATESDHVYQGRLFWPAPFRDEVLGRLLDLNRARAEAERLKMTTIRELEG